MLLMRLYHAGYALGVQQERVQPSRLKVTGLCFVLFVWFFLNLLDKGDNCSLTHLELFAAQGCAFVLYQTDVIFLFVCLQTVRVVGVSLCLGLVLTLK